MSKINLNKISHSYNPNDANPTYALNPFSMTWEDGKRYAILGPSGCGKTTMLNIVSGLVRPSSGKILFDEKDVTDLKTENRNIAQVFQFPVIYSTMTVYDNLAFPLRCRDFSKEIVEERVNSVAETLNLKSFLKLPARKLTADQKQLISLGRGLVREDVAAVLMDEPLTVIDPDLKFKLRRNLKEINEKYKTTLVYVTHDQTEAMTLADRLAVINDGRIEQMGAPIELYNNPATLFVASFIGAPQINLIPVQFKNNKLISGDIELSGFKGLPENTELVLGIRPDVITPNKNGQLEIKVDLVEQHGADNLIYGALSGAAKADIDDTEICFKTAQGTLPDIDSVLKLHFDQKTAMIFNKESGERLI